MRVILLLLFAFTAQTYARENKLSAGLVVGDDSGINLQSYFPDDRFLSFTFSEDKISAVHNWYMATRDNFKFYLGLGLGFKFGNHKHDKDGLEGRIPFGAAYFFDENDLTAYLQMTPSFIDGESDFGLQVGLNYIF